MAILNLDKVQIKPSIEGATCPKCGGDLVPSKLKSILGKMLSVLSLGILKIHNYKCQNCQKEYNLF
jgi:transposase-like protein